jgi:hypothetical protein
MDPSIIVAVITTGGGLLVASLMFYLTKRDQLRAGWQKEKVNHYKILLSALSDLAIDGTDKDDANRRFSLAVNTVCLVAPQYVIDALMKFHDAVKFSNPNKSIDLHDRCLKDLMLAIRRDIGLSGRDRRDDFTFHLIGSKPK